MPPLTVKTYTAQVECVKKQKNHNVDTKLKLLCIDSIK